MALDLSWHLSQDMNSHPDFKMFNLESFLEDGTWWQEAPDLFRFQATHRGVRQDTFEVLVPRGAPDGHRVTFAGKAEVTPWWWRMGWLLGWRSMGWLLGWLRILQLRDVHKKDGVTKGDHWIVRISLSCTLGFFLRDIMDVNKYGSESCWSTCREGSSNFGCQMLSFHLINHYRTNSKSLWLL